MRDVCSLPSTPAPFSCCRDRSSCRSAGRAAPQGRPYAERVADFPDVRLHVVSGKGGTGKTTVAAALALALAGGGKRVLLVEVEGRQGIAQLFDVPPLPYAERSVAVAPGGGEVYALAVDPEEALLDYLHMFYKLSPTGIPARTLRRAGAIDFATTIAPGMRDVLLTGKVKEAVVRRQGKKGAAARAPARRCTTPSCSTRPPTGRIARFLNISQEVSGLAKVGPIKTQSEGVMAVLRSPQTAVHLVTLLEEMPVQETIDGIGELQAVDLPVGGVVVNAVRAPLLSPADLKAAESGVLDAEQLAAGLRRAGIEPDARRSSQALAAEAVDHASRVALEERGRDALAALSRPTYELPLLPDAVDLGGLYALAADAQGPGDRMTAPAGYGRARARRRRGAAHRADPRLLRVRRRRQDDDRRRARAARRRARPPHGRADDRPGQAAGAVDGPVRARQHARARWSGVRPAEGGAGSLDAMMLDMKRTFDQLVVDHADPGKAEQILANPFYQALSSSFAGTQEYMAMEKLAQLVGSGDHDLVVVDTPPTRSALDFLDAPQRLTTFLDGRMVRILLAPAKAGGRAYFKVVTAGLGVFTSVLTRIIGTEVLSDLSQFVAALETMFGGFRERAQATYDLLKAPGTAFVVVAAPERDAMREAAYFVERLAAERMPLAGLVVNRVHRSAAGGLTAGALARRRPAARGAGARRRASWPPRCCGCTPTGWRSSAREARLQERFSRAHPRRPGRGGRRAAGRRARPRRAAGGRRGPGRRAAGGGPHRVLSTPTSVTALQHRAAPPPRAPRGRAQLATLAERWWAVRASCSSAVQLVTSGRRRSSARRSRSVIPPHTPNSTRLSSASPRHSVRTGQPRQTALARFCAAPVTNSSSGSLVRHAERAVQSCCASGLASEIMGMSLPGRGLLRGRTQP